MSHILTKGAPLLVFTILLNQGCYKDKGINGLLIINKSEKSIYIGNQNNYPDTSISGYYPGNDAHNFKILSHSEKSIISRSWPLMVTSCISDTIMFFIYDAQTLETTPWDTVKNKYMIIKRYDLSLDDLEKSNWTITYP